MNNNTAVHFLCFILSLIVLGCQKDEAISDGKLFELMKTQHTQINFENALTYTNDFNIYKYRNYYNGGGVALGDVNNDGLLDVFFTANLLSNRLYLNLGGFKFKDITETAGVGGKQAWSTGVSMVDINADGWLDIYVCNSGDVDGDNKRNEFFINNGDGTFTDKASELGLADKGFSTHASFFDYDKDGDLDMYLLNNSYRAIGSFNLRKNQRGIRDKDGGDKLFRNDDGIFTDVTEYAGIYGSEIGFGLGVSVADIDKDGWMDIYVCNDFFERDYLYINNQDGTFTEDLENQMRSIGVASMGSDIADMNGDGYPEIFVTEMLPRDNERYKTTMTFEDWDKYQYNVKNGYYHQFTRNMLHLHNGVSDNGKVTFSEIGRQLNVEATDWSWSALITDFDNNGQKDLYITNGLAQDILNQDYLQYVANEEVTRMVVSETGVDYKHLIDIIPVNKIPNYAFGGFENFDFKDKTLDWGLAQPSHSNGAAYGDLDNDGALDLIVNNVNMPAFVYRNTKNNQVTDNHFLTIELKGGKQNLHAVGAKITAYSENRIFYVEQSPNRGFQSSVDPRLHIGLGKTDKIDSLVIDWYYGKRTVVLNPKVNQRLIFYENDALSVSNQSVDQSKESIFSEVTNNLGINIKHEENAFIDFNRNRLLYHMKSTEGPKMAKADINGDGLEDFHFGGAKGSPGKILMQQKGGFFKITNQEVMDFDSASEDTGSIFFDADGDNDLDLYVTSGGSEFGNTSFALFDRLYLNDGRGNFTKSKVFFPTNNPESTNTVKAADFDNDGDIDLFVGVRLNPDAIGVPQNGYILVNDGEGNFLDMTDELGPGLKSLGMITDAVWSDFDLDGDQDLIIVGEWMPIKVFSNQDGKLIDASDNLGLSMTNGLWKKIIATDLDNDGDVDYVLGNNGTNSILKASKTEPLFCYVNDYDKNGSIEQIICTSVEGVPYPKALRHDLVAQLPSLKKKFLKYEDYKDKTIFDIFSEEELDRSIIHQVFMLESVILRNEGQKGLKIEVLPKEAQVSPTYAIEVADFDGDNRKDILLAGNLHGVKPEIGRYDASYGVLLSVDNDGRYTALDINRTGLYLEGEVRDLNVVEVQDEKLLIVVNNNGPIKIYHINK